MQVYFATVPLGVGEIEHVARSLADSGVFGNPFGYQTGPTAHVAPGYPLFLGLVYRVFGECGIAAQRLLNAAVVAAHYALLPGFAMVCGLPLRAGVVAGLVAAIGTYKMYVETTGNWEAAYVALAIVLLLWTTLRAWQREDGTSSPALKRGLGWGVALLLSPVLLILLASILLAEMAMFRRFRPALIVFATAAMMQIPWTIRNQMAMGAPVWSRSNFGVELRISNNGAARPLLEENLSQLNVYHPAVGGASRYQEIGEVRYYQESFAGARTWIGEHPAAFLKLTAQRIAAFWVRSTNRTWTNRITTALTILGLAGFAFSRMPRRTRLLFLLLWTCYPLVYYAVQVDRRYRYPIEWSFVLMAAALKAPSAGPRLGRSKPAPSS